MDRSVTQQSTGTQPAARTPAGLWFGFFAPPIAWGIQLLVGYVLAMPSCQIGSKIWMYLLSGAAGVVTLIAGGIALRNWRSLDRSHHPVVLDTEEPINRSEFIALAGVIVSIVFFLLVLYTGAASVFLNPCPIITQPLP